MSRIKNNLHLHINDLAVQLNRTNAFSFKLLNYVNQKIDMFINMRQFLAILWTFELLLHFDQLFSSNLQSGD